MIATNSLRAFDRIFDSMSRMHGFRNPLDMSTQIIKNLETNMVVNDPIAGTYTTYKLVPQTFMPEVQPDGSVMHKLLTDEDIEVLKTQRVEKKSEVE